jgi:hypothetical protein
MFSILHSITNDPHHQITAFFFSPFHGV